MRATQQRNYSSFEISRIHVFAKQLYNARDETESPSHRVRRESARVARTSTAVVASSLFSRMDRPLSVSHFFEAFADYARRRRPPFPCSVPLLSIAAGTAALQSLPLFPSLSAALLFQNILCKVVQPNRYHDASWRCNDRDSVSASARL